MIPQVGGFQGCYPDNHRNNWRCARAVRALWENAPTVSVGTILIWNFGAGYTKRGGKGTALLGPCRRKHRCLVLDTGAFPCLFWAGHHQRWCPSEPAFVSLGHTPGVSGGPQFLSAVLTASVHRWGQRMRMTSQVIFSWTSFLLVKKPGLGRVEKRSFPSQVRCPVHMKAIRFRMDLDLGFGCDC